MTAIAPLRAKLRARVGRLGIDVELDTGAGTLVVVGPNGAGKSSLLALLLSALPCETARIAIGDAALVDSANGVDTPVEARRLAWVPQGYALFPHLTVRENVVFAVTSAEGAPRDRAAITARVDAALADLGVATLADRRPGTLSGGERQRVALARALSVQPRALLLDEPLAALDVHARRSVRAFLADKLRTLGIPSVVVTHDAADVRALGQRVLVLEAGRVVQTGTWSDLVERPASPFVEELVADR